MVMNVNLLESWNLNCMCAPKTADDKADEVVAKQPRGLHKGMVELAETFKIVVLPAWTDIDLADLYPATNHVESWNTLVVGKDKNYIMVNIGDVHAQIPGSDKLINRKGTNVLPEQLDRIFSKIWDETFSHNKLQFCMMWNSVLYFVNTWALKNAGGKSVGAVMFMRSFENLPELIYGENEDGTMSPKGFRSCEMGTPPHPTGFRTSEDGTRTRGFVSSDDTTRKWCGPHSGSFRMSEDGVRPRGPATAADALRAWGSGELASQSAASVPVSAAIR
jgi:hypothetical protein